MPTRITDRSPHGTMLRILIMLMIVEAFRHTMDDYGFPEKDTGLTRKKLYPIIPCIELLYSIWCAVTNYEKAHNNTLSPLEKRLHDALGEDLLQDFAKDPLTLTIKSNPILTITEDPTHTHSYSKSSYDSLNKICAISRKPILNYIPDDHLEAAIHDWLLRLEYSATDYLKTLQHGNNNLKKMTLTNLNPHEEKLYKVGYEGVLPGWLLCAHSKRIMINPYIDTETRECYDQSALSLLSTFAPNTKLIPHRALKEAIADWVLCITTELSNRITSKQIVKRSLFQMETYQNQTTSVVNNSIRNTF